jgi:hypothetical protein
MAEVETDRLIDVVVTAEAGGDQPAHAPGFAAKRVKTGGRAKGTPNRVTRSVRDALKELAESNVERVAEWLDAVARESPAEALRLYLALIRYVVPTLSAAAIADITPRSSREQLAKMSSDELMEIVLNSPQAAKLVLEGKVKTKSELIRGVTGAPVPALPKPDPTDDEELLK